MLKIFPFFWMSVRLFCKMVKIFFTVDTMLLSDLLMKDLDQTGKPSIDMLSIHSFPILYSCKYFIMF